MLSSAPSPSAPTLVFYLVIPSSAVDIEITFKGFFSVEIHLKVRCSFIFLQ